ncbi:hypothetical protein DCS_00811 [Drechmeria coniospora]|uniref:Nucleotide-binding, alpha-beta plait n=1 Tax=Drechmeria coniospora TaxID=98403 RepID=A0A151GRD3_DRECN|nr:hypothetical protein DCS_00811 [Drechmeria coniospora]KYK59677.1 hypothetical protein DCS_00811 [Drechmeria coniospora]
MDLDIEMGDAEVAQEVLPLVDPTSADDILGSNEPEEPGELPNEDVSARSEDAESTKVMPTKLHIHGLDILSSDDIKSYVREHYGDVDRIEWIDDASANLVFASELTAREAIVALSSIEVADATALPVGEAIPAKPLNGKPEVSLRIRFATQGDRKKSGAALRSRYYLLHPEHDPEERRRLRRDEGRGRYRDRTDGYRRSGRQGYGLMHDVDNVTETFEASMYDDAPRPRPHPPRSESDDDSRRPARDNRGKELFRERSSARRDRSASPRRRGDGGAHMDNLASSLRNNKEQARSIRGRPSEENRAVELFPTKVPGRGGQLDLLERSIGSARLKEDDIPKVVEVPVGSTSKDAFSIRGLASQRTDKNQKGMTIKGAAASAKELFPERLGSNNSSKELIDPSRVRRRQKAHDVFN